MSEAKVEVRAKDVMVGEPVTVEPATTARELIRIFEEYEISGAPVVDQSDRLLGIVSKSDIIRRLVEGPSESAPAYLFEMLAEQGEDEIRTEPEEVLTVQDLMTEDPISITSDTPISKAAQLMSGNRMHRVVVVDEGRTPIGIITSLDLLGAFSR